MSQQYQDQQITCSDCQNTFEFTASEQAFFEEKGFTPPKRCKPCRQVRKDRQGANGGNGGERPTRQSRGGGGGGSRQLYDVVCSDCGANAQVPFQPSGDRPVYCRDCFRGSRR